LPILFNLFTCVQQQLEEKMVLLNQIWFVPLLRSMMREVRPMNSNLKHMNQPGRWKEVDRILDVLYGDVLRTVPSAKIHGSSTAPEPKSHGEITNQGGISSLGGATIQGEITSHGGSSSLGGTTSHGENTISEKKKKTPDNYRLQLDVSQFMPEKINVRVVGRDVVIDGKYEEHLGHRFISRAFSRRYTLPEDVDNEKMACQLSKDGKLLKLEAPRKEAPRKEAIEDTPRGQKISIENEPAGDTVGSDTKKV